MIISTITDAAGGTEDAIRGRPAHITGGTLIPIAARTRISSRRTTATVANRNFFLPSIRFAQDRIAVIEGIEKLRQLKGMLGKISRFSGRDALAHNIRGFSRRQPKLPYIVGSFAVKEPQNHLRQNHPPGKIACRDAACRVSARTGMLVDVETRPEASRQKLSGSSPPFRKILEARTTAYCA